MKRWMGLIAKFSKESQWPGLLSQPDWTYWLREVQIDHNHTDEFWKEMLGNSHGLTGVQREKIQACGRLFHKTIQFWEDLKHVWQKCKCMAIEGQGSDEAVSIYCRWGGIEDITSKMSKEATIRGKMCTGKRSGDHFGRN